MVCVSIHVQIKHVFFRSQYIQTSLECWNGTCMSAYMKGRSQCQVSSSVTVHLTYKIKFLLNLNLASSALRLYIGGYHHFQVLCESWGSKCR